MADIDTYSSAEFRLAYYGEEVDSHTIAARDLSIALAAASDLFIESNRVLNGNKGSVELRVNSRIHVGCFDLGLELIQLWNFTKDLVLDENVVAAKEIFNWVALASGSLLVLYKKLGGEEPVAKIKFKDENGNAFYRLQFRKSDDQILDEKQYKLYMSNIARRKTRKFLNPLIKNEKIDSIKLYDEEDGKNFIIISKEDARNINFDPFDESFDNTEKVAGEPFEAILKVYSPVYDLKAPKWRFWYKGKHYYMDVSDSDIAKFVIENGGVLINDQMRVLMQANIRDLDGGETSLEYKILKVLDFIPSERQTDLFRPRS